MTVKRCLLCKKPAYLSVSKGNSDKKWICSSCEKKFLNNINTGFENQNIGNLCNKCIKKNRNQCRFTVFERQKITACTDWEGKDTERNKRRWAKFEE